MSMCFCILLLKNEWPVCLVGQKLVHVCFKQNIARIGWLELCEEKGKLLMHIIKCVNMMMNYIEI